MIRYTVREQSARRIKKSAGEIELNEKKGEEKRKEKRREGRIERRRRETS